MNLLINSYWFLNIVNDWTANFEQKKDGWNTFSIHYIEFIINQFDNHIETH